VQALDGGKAEAARRSGDDGDAAREVGCRRGQRDGRVCRREDASIWFAPPTSANCALLIGVSLALLSARVSSCLLVTASDPKISLNES
jgi:hypothetical protein